MSDLQSRLRASMNKHSTIDLDEQAKIIEREIRRQRRIDWRFRKAVRDARRR